MQYRHLDQILLDIAGYGDAVLMCRQGKAGLVDPDAVDTLLRAGGASGALRLGRQI